MTFSDIASIVSTIIATGAFYLSYKAFQQQRTFENENHYYEYKFNNYAEMLRLLGNYLYDVQSLFFTGIDNAKKKTITKEGANMLFEEMNTRAVVLQNNLEALKNFLPIAVIDKIDKVLDIIFNGGIGEGSNKDEIQQAQEHFKILAEAIGDVEVAMINDLGLDNIHERLSNRTRVFRKKENI